MPDTDLIQRSQKTFDRFKELHETLLNLQIIANRFHSQAPYSEKNKKKGLAIVRGKFWARTQGKLTKLQEDYQKVREILGEWRSVGGVRIFRKIKALNDAFRGAKEREIESLLAAITRNYSYNMEGVFYQQLSQNKFDELTPDKIKRKNENSILAVLTIVKTGLQSSELILSKVKTLGRQGLGEIRRRRAYAR